jgi:hypothetical protein
MRLASAYESPSLAMLVTGGVFCLHHARRLRSAHRIGELTDILRNGIAELSHS